MTASASAGVLQVHNPATGDLVAEYPAHTGEQIEAALAVATSAQRDWRGVAVADRAALLGRLGAILAERAGDYGRLITTEMGKPAAEATAEVAKCAATCRWYAEHAPALLADEVLDSRADASWLRWEPLGVVLAVMPWNFPFWQVIRFAAPALAAGNGALLKHSPNVSGCALALERAVADAGFPAGLFASLLIPEAAVSDRVAALVADPRIAAVTLTGSERAGTSLAAAAGGALKKTVLELGGSDPFVVLDDVDVAVVAGHAVRARFANAGQSCIAAKRFVVAEPVADRFQAALVQAVRALRVGDPADPDTTVGPLARPDLVIALDEQVRASVAQGATVLLGGTPLPGPGCFYAPTVLADVTPDMPVFREETFGPVAVLVRAADDDEAVALANDTRFGLGASVWSVDPARAFAVGARINSGALFVNAVVASDPSVPFGGIARSGHGRELGALGIREFTNARTVWSMDRPAPG